MREAGRKDMRRRPFANWRRTLAAKATCGEGGRVCVCVCVCVCV